MLLAQIIISTDYYCGADGLNHGAAGTGKKIFEAVFILALENRCNLARRVVFATQYRRYEFLM